MYIAGAGRLHSGACRIQGKEVLLELRKWGSFKRAIVWLCLVFILHQWLPNQAHIVWHQKMPIRNPAWGKIFSTLYVSISFCCLILWDDCRIVRDNSSPSENWVLVSSAHSSDTGLGVTALSGCWPRYQGRMWVSEGWHRQEIRAVFSPFSDKMAGDSLRVQESRKAGTFWWSDWRLTDYLRANLLYK